MKILQSMLEGGQNPLLLLIVQIGLILGLSRLLGMAVVRVHQPQVVGEMLAGLMLGPSLFGWLFPHAAATVFPATSMAYLNILSQIGVIYFLFLVGLELDLGLLRNRGRTAVIISQASILAPLILGGTLAVILYDRLLSTAPHVTMRSAALFMGASMSITAFPVLARILTERNLHKTKVGAIAITCAAVDDVTAWCLLALVVGLTRAQGMGSGLRTAALALAYIAVMFFIIRPFLRRLQLVHQQQNRLSQHMIALVFLLVLASAFVTEIIGIHALFGAFLMGAIMPKGSKFVHTITEKLDDFTVVFLLPIFFAYTGLRTQIGALNSGTMWMYCGLIIAVACVGKFGGSTVSARLCGLSWRDSAAIGTLMNTRGLMELIILNVGRDLGVINNTVFAMMVIMALVTTALTTPALHWILPRKLMEKETVPDTGGGYSVLIPVSMPSSGGSLLQLADALTGADDTERQIFALALRPPQYRDAYRSALNFNEPAENIDSLQPLLDEAKKREVTVTPVSFVSRDIPSDISRTARLRGVDLILMGFHNPVYTSSILGGTVHRVLTGSDSDVAIFVDRSIGVPKKVLVPYRGSKHDRLALELASRMGRNVKATVTVLHVVQPGSAPTEQVFSDPSQPQPVTMKTVEGTSPVDVVVEQAKDFDLVVIGVAEEWGLESQLLGFRAERIAREVACSLLIVRKHGEFRAARGIPRELDKPDAVTPPVV
jgi:Kef-type K+ transport system membrane component KefB/nucleotide-binding universal stress UspA family protein